MGGIQGRQVSILQISVSAFIPFFIGIVLWLFPVIVAKSILKSEINQEIEPTNKASIFSIMISTLGLYVSLYAFIDITYYFTLWQIASSPDNYGNTYDLFSPETKANIWATIAELILGLFLIFKSKAIAKKMFSMAS